MKRLRLLGNTALTPILAAGMLALAPSAAFGQDGGVAAEAGPNQEADDANESIVVTGSRVARPNTVSTVPITSVGAPELIDRGDVSLGDALNELPALRSTYSSANSTRFIGTVGLNLLDLRGLGTDRTLTLVNGRRHVTASPGSGEVDVNTIPTDLLERVDIVTGGNSAIYGSDAVAGVVNFILKRDFEGIRMRAQSGVSTYGDRPTWFASLTAGENFLDDRVNIAGNVEYARTDVLYHTDRDDQTGAISGYKGFGRVVPTTLRRPGLTELAFLEGFRHGSVSVGGMISTVCPAAPGATATPEQAAAINARRAAVCTGENSPTGTPLADNYVFLSGGQLVRNDPYGDLRPVGGGLLGGYGATLFETTMLQPRVERFSTNILVNADLSPAFQPFIEAKFVRVNALQSGQPTFGNYVYRIDNPFLTEEARSTLRTILPAGATTFSAFRFNTDFGGRGEEHERDVFRIVAGTGGEITPHLNYEVAFNYGRLETYYETKGNILLDNFDNARDAVRNASGQIVCRINLDPATTDPNCVPINLFGSGSPSREALDYISHTSSREGLAEQKVATAFISGDTGGFFELPGGPIGFAIGGEYRRESAYEAYDEITARGDTFLNAIAPFDPPALEIKEAFGEVRLPILADMPLFHELSVEAAARFSDYSAGPAGTVFAWNVGASWAPVRDLRFRASLSQSVRAPSLGQLFDTASETFAFITDPCDQDQITLNPNRAKNCAAAGVPTTETLADGRVVPWTNQTSGSHLGRSQGNENVSEETGRSFTAGFVFQPRAVPGLTLSADYYDIDIKDVIASLGGQTIVDLCYDSPSGLDNQYCDAVQRNADGTFAGQADRRIGGTGGPLLDLIRTGPTFLQQPFNFARRKAEGVDVDLSYVTSLSQGIRLDLRGILTYVINRENFTDVNAPDYATRLHGTLGDPVWGASFNADLDFGLVDVAYNMRYVGRQTLDSWETHFSHQGRPAQSPDLYPIDYYPDVIYHNLRLGVEPTDKFRFYAGIDNVLNRLPPYDLSAVGYSTSMFGNGAIYPNTGRFFYAGVDVRF